jgi:hypothetical protein
MDSNIPSWSFPDTTGFNPNDTRGYYYGVQGDPKLIASSRPGPWRYQQTGPFPDIKSIFHAGEQPALQNAFENNDMWNDLLNILMAFDGWVSLSVFRIGYEISSSPVTILVTVEPRSTTFEDAKKIIVEIKNLCIA